jgi:hypothetical protein
LVPAPPGWEDNTVTVAFQSRLTDGLGGLRELGGVIDDPFRYSDDINRFLLFLKVFLFRGEFLSESIIDVTRLIRH